MKLATAWHLTRRFAGSLRPGPPAAADERWAEGLLSDGERSIWRRMSNPDRRHAVEVARAVDAELGPDCARPVLAAALLHDSGKIESGLRTPARVIATVFWLGVDHAKAPEWRDDGRWLRRRLAEYRLHPELGAEQLSAIDSDPLTIAWTREHHLPAEEWTLPVEVASVLKACDDD